ncbi:MAG: glycosyltransferase family 2 protein [Kiritimatiellaeota bacterium]|nr:glycosyltransferase family 2 protein [Kiritimatiellota bacterium]
MFSRLSIMIVTYKRDDLLGACLASIHTACPSMPQTVVVDNGDSPETQTLVQSYPNTTYIPSPGNPGFAGGSNLGLPACTGEYIASLNNDTLVHDEPFTCMMSYLDAHPSVGVILGKLRIPHLNNLLDGCGTMLSGTGYVNTRGFLVKDDPEFCQPSPVFAANGACFMFRKSLLEQMGGVWFHTHFKSYFEDVDFCHRAWISGAEVHYVPTPIVDHHHSLTSNQFPRLDILRQYYANMWFSHLTCLDAYGQLRVLPGFAFIYFGHSALRLCIGQFAYFGIHYSALRDVWRKRADIRRTRALVRATRKRSSREIFRLVMRSPPISYYAKLLRDIVKGKTI